MRKTKELKELTESKALMSRLEEVANMAKIHSTLPSAKPISPFQSISIETKP